MDLEKTIFFKSFMKEYGIDIYFDETDDKYISKDKKHGIIFYDNKVLYYFYENEENVSFTIPQEQVEYVSFFMNFVQLIKNKIDYS